MQRTQHYALNQYEPGDSFLRTDFNADNAKIDGALAGLRGRLDAGLALKADQTALTQGLATKCEVYLGSYGGQVVEDSAEIQTISLGFRPRAVFLLPTNGYLSDTSGRRYGGLMGPGFPIYSLDPETGWMGRVTDTGFQVRNRDHTLLNLNIRTYTYLALR